MSAPLELTFADRYRLWQELVREAELHSGRIFLPTDAALEPGQECQLLVQVVEPDLRVPLAGRVEARRAPSQRFARGLFVRLPRDEITKLHEALGLLPPEVARGRGRRRYPMRWPVRFRTPALPKMVFTDDISAEGMQVEMPERVRAGHVLEFSLETPQGHELALRGEVAWTSERTDRVGVRFRFPDDETADFFGEMVELVGGFFREESGEGAAVKRPVVLLADPDPSVAVAVRAALGKGVKVISTPGGNEALAKIREVRPRVAVLDLLLPQIDGPTVCRTVRGDAELLELPVVFLSSAEEATLAASAQAAGANRWLRKPFNPEQLLAALKPFL